MGQKFNHCPNCERKPGGGILGGSYFKVYECKECGQLYCHNCGGSRCPDCGSKKRRVAGKVHK